MIPKIVSAIVSAVASRIAFYRIIPSGNKAVWVVLPYLSWFAREALAFGARRFVQLYRGGLPYLAVLLMATAMIACAGEEGFEDRDSQVSSPQFSSFTLTAEDNPQLDHDVVGQIDHDEAKITIELPQGVELHSLIARFHHNGQKVLVEGEKQESGKTILNFEHIVEYTLVDQKDRKSTYSVKVQRAQELIPPEFDGIKNATAVDPHTIDIAWPQAQDEECRAEQIRYRIYLHQDKDKLFTDGAKITTEPGLLQFALGGLDSDSEYFVALRAMDTSGNLDTNQAILSVQLPRAARLVVSEVYTVDSSVDALELRVVQEGSLQGISVRQKGSRIYTFTTRQTFVQGDILVIHTQENGLDETNGNPQEATHPSATPAYDFWQAEIGSLTSTDSEITVVNGKKEILDFLPWSDGELGRGQMERIEEAVQTNQWRLAGETVHPDDLLPSFFLVSGQSFQRFGHREDNNNKQDWFVAETSLGSDNTYPKTILFKAQRLQEQSIELTFSRNIDPESIYDISSQFVVNPQLSFTSVTAVQGKKVILASETIPDNQTFTITVDSSIKDWRGQTISAQQNQASFVGPTQLTGLFINEWADAGSDIDYIEIKNFSTGDIIVTSSNLAIVYGDMEQTQASLTHVCHDSVISQCKEIDNGVAISSQEIFLVMDGDAEDSDLEQVRAFNGFTGKILLSSESTLIGSGDRLSDNPAKLCNGDCSREWSVTPPSQEFADQVGDSTYSYLASSFDPSAQQTTDPSVWHNGTARNARSAGIENP